MSSVRIKDVAKLSGVSTATVSHGSAIPSTRPQISALSSPNLTEGCVAEVGLSPSHRSAFDAMAQRCRAVALEGVMGKSFHNLQLASRHSLAYKWGTKRGFHESHFQSDLRRCIAAVLYAEYSAPIVR